MGNISLIKRSTAEKLKQFFSVVLAFTTTLSLSGFALTFAFTAAAQVATLNDGDLVRGPDGIKVYIVKTNVAHGAFAGWKRHIFNPAVFNMYGHLKWSSIKSVNQATLDAYQNSDLYQAAGTAEVYSLEEMGASAVKHWITDPATFAANGYSWSQIFTVIAAERDFYASGANVGSATTPTTPTTPAATGTGLSVSLASNTPAAGSVVADSTSGDGAQAQASMTTVNFTAGTDGDVNVTTVKVKRSGISADSDLTNAYLYDGSVRIAEMTSISSNYITFTVASGLFTVSRGTTKAITVKVDIANGTTAGKTISLSINAATDIVAGSAAVSGTFPITGNFMTTAAVGDLGKITVATVGAASATVDPGQTAYELWRFSLMAADQQVNVSSIRVTNIGSVGASDLTNIKLYDGATQLGSTVAALGTGVLTFDLSASPLHITAGVTKNLSLKGDIVGGTTRTYRFSIQRSADLVAMDNNYGVSLKPNQTDSFTIIQASAATTINSGSLTISVDPASPTGNVAKDYIDQELARFQFKANGEAIKITSLSASSTVTGNVGINNAKLYLDGSQVGSTTDLPVGTSATFTFGNTFTIPVGATKTLVVKGEVKNAAGGAFTAGDTIKIFLVAGSSNVQGQTSLTVSSSTASNGNTLTVQAGTMAVTLNSGLGDATTSLPTGVKGATNVKIGSFVLTAGSGEAVQVSQMVVKNSTTAGLVLSLDFQNLTLKNGTSVIGSPIGALSSTTGATYTFTPSSVITIAAGQQYVVDVYADILTGASNAGASGANAQVVWDDVTATGVSTSAAAGVTTDVTGQLVYISTGGSLVIAAASDMPVAQNRSMGQVGQTLASFKFTTGAPEGVNVTQLIVTDTMSGTASAATGTITNLGLFKGDGVQVGTYVASMTASGIQDVKATFNGLTLALPRDTATVLYLKGDVNGYPNGVSGSAHTFKIALASDVTATGAVGGTTVTATGPVITGNATRVYRSELTVANAMSSISGGSGAGQNIGKYRFTNTSAGNYSITVNNVMLGVATTITNTNASRYITLRRDSTSGAIIANKVFKNTNFADVTSWALSGTDATEQAFSPFTIDAVGGTGYVDVYVLADTGDAVGTKTISTAIGSGTNTITWTDGVSSTTNLDNTPIAGATVTY